MKFSSFLSKPKTLEMWDEYHLAKFEIVKLTPQKSMARCRSISSNPGKCCEI